jgi:hypothetical protein
VRKTRAGVILMARSCLINDFSLTSHFSVTRLGRKMRLPVFLSLTIYIYIATLNAEFRTYFKILLYAELQKNKIWFWFGSN